MRSITGRAPCLMAESNSKTNMKDSFIYPAGARYFLRTNECQTRKNRRNSYNSMLLGNILFALFDWPVHFHNGYQCPAGCFFIILSYGICVLVDVLK